MGFEETLSLEALVFHYTSAAGSRWPWLAIVFAVSIGFLSRLLPAIFSSLSSIPVKPPMAGPAPPAAAEREQQKNNARQKPPGTGEPTPTATTGGLDVVGGTTKGRFTAYYNTAEDNEDEELEIAFIQQSYDDNVAEEKMKMTATLLGCWCTDLGWYEFQDWKLINGNVVTLWNGARGHCCRRMTAAPGRAIGMY